MRSPGREIGHKRHKMHIRAGRGEGKPQNAEH